MGVAMTVRYLIACAGLLAAIWSLAPATAATSEEAQITGFGVVVTRKGHVFAPLRVVEGCESLRSPTLGALRLLHHDPDLRLALLQAEGGASAPVPFGNSGTIEPGGPLLVVEPAPGAPAGPDFVVSGAIVRALVGSMTEASFITVIAADRPERADALLFGHTGGLVGFMVGDMDRRTLAYFDVRLWTGPPKGNVGMRDAIGERVLRHALEDVGAAPEAVVFSTDITAEEIAARARDHTTPVVCGRR